MKVSTPWAVAIRTWKKFSQIRNLSFQLPTIPNFLLRPNNQSLKKWMLIRTRRLRKITLNGVKERLLTWNFPASVQNHDQLSVNSRLRGQKEQKPEPKLPHRKNNSKKVWMIVKVNRAVRAVKWINLHTQFCQVQSSQKIKKKSLNFWISKQRKSSKQESKGKVDGLPT